jgi:integrase
MIKRYTNQKVEQLHGRTLYALGGGLSVREKSDGRKYYVFIYRQRTDGKKRELTFGPTAKLDIRDAYNWAREQLTLRANSIDPWMQKRAKEQKAKQDALKSRTFGEVAKDYCDDRSDPKDPRHWVPETIDTMQGIRQRIAKETPAFNKRLMPSIGPADAADVIKYNERNVKTPVMALRFLDLITGTLGFANEHGEGYAPPNYDSAIFRRRVNRLAPIRHTSKHHPGWHHDDAPRLHELLLAAENDCSHDGLWTTAQAAKKIGRERFSVLALINRGELPAVKGGSHGKTSTWLVKPADVERFFDIKVPSAEPNFGEAHLALPLLRLLQLTAVRFSEANEMDWDEIDPDKRLWTIRAERTKSKRKHLVPLVDEAWAIIEKMQARNIDSPYVFARGPTLTGADFHLGKPLTRECVIKHLRKACGDPIITHHSLRRNCRSWIEEQMIYWPIIGRAILGHATSSGLDYVYGGDAIFVVPCRKALGGWADYLKYRRLPAGSQSAADVVSLDERRAANA